MDGSPSAIINYIWCLKLNELKVVDIDGLFERYLVESLGPVYDLTLPKQLPNRNSPQRQILKQDIQALNSILSTSVGIDRSSLSGIHDPMDQQAEMFMSFILGFTQMGQDIFDAGPAVHALMFALKSGWKPKTLGIEFLSLLFNWNLLPHINRSSSEFQLSQNMLDSAVMQCGPLSICVLKSLLHYLQTKTCQIFMTNETVLRLHNSMRPYYSSIFSSILKRILLVDAVNSLSTTRKSTLWWKSCSLGDRVTITMSNKIQSATIVKVDVLLNNFTLEYDTIEDGMAAGLFSDLFLTLARDDPRLSPYSAENIHAPTEVDNCIVEEDMCTSGDSFVDRIYRWRCQESVVDLVMGSPNLVPMCENGHRCGIVSGYDSVSSSSEYICGVCNKRRDKRSYCDARTAVFGTHYHRLAGRRFRRWVCRQCKYTVCLECKSEIPGFTRLLRLGYNVTSVDARVPLPQQQRQQQQQQQQQPPQEVDLPPQLHVYSEPVRSSSASPLVAHSLGPGDVIEVLSEFSSLENLEPDENSPVLDDFGGQLNVDAEKDRSPASSPLSPRLSSVSARSSPLAGAGAATDRASNLSELRSKPWFELADGSGFLMIPATTGWTYSLLKESDLPEEVRLQEQCTNVERVGADVAELCSAHQQVTQNSPCAQLAAVIDSIVQLNCIRLNHAAQTVELGVPTATGSPSETAQKTEASGKVAAGPQASGAQHSGTRDHNESEEVKAVQDLLERAKRLFYMTVEPIPSSTAEENLVANPSLPTGSETSSTADTCQSSCFSTDERCLTEASSDRNVEQYRYRGALMTGSLRPPKLGRPWVVSAFGHLSSGIDGKLSRTVGDPGGDASEIGGGSSSSSSNLSVGDVAGVNLRARADSCIHVPRTPTPSVKSDFRYKLVSKTIGPSSADSSTTAASATESEDLHPDIVCGKCREPIRAWPQLRWSTAWVCDSPHHRGSSMLGIDDPLYGCDSSKSCDWGVCQVCWDRVRLHCPLWVIDDDDDIPTNSPNKGPTMTQDQLPGAQPGSVTPAVGSATMLRGADGLLYPRKVATEPRDALASVTFDGIIQEIVAVIARHIEARTTALLDAIVDVKVEDLAKVDISYFARVEQPVTGLVATAFEIIRLIYRSQHRVVLVESFYRVLIGRCALRVKAEMESITMSCGDTANYYGTLRRFFAVEKAYSLILMRTCPCPLNYKHLSDKISYAVRILGSGLVSDRMMELCTKFTDSSALLTLSHAEGHISASPVLHIVAGISTDTNSASATETEDFATRLRAHFLDAANPFSHPPKALRKLIKVMCNHASPGSVTTLESFWTEVVATWATDACISAHIVGHRVTPINNGLNAKALKFVDTWMKMLKRAQEATKRSFPVATAGQRHFVLAPSKAFACAYRRLPEDLYMELTKALAVRLAMLLDSKKAGSRTDNWSEQIESLTEFIQIITQDCSREFQHFYELLLAWRLLRERHLTLATESHTLQSLPWMKAGLQMTRDIERVPSTTQRFHKFLLGRLDANISSLSPAIAQSLLSDPDAVNITVLTGSVWPSQSLSPCSFAQLKLPPLLEQLRREFETFYVEESRKLNERSFIGVGVKTKFGAVNQEGIVVSGCGGDGAINGLYVPTNNLVNGFPTYKQQHTPHHVLHYSINASSWQIKLQSSTDSNFAAFRSSSSNNNSNNKCLAYCTVDAREAFPACLLTATRRWEVPAGSKYAGSTLTLHSDGTLSKDLGGKGCHRNIGVASVPEVYLSHGPRKLIWCHAVSSVIIQVTYPVVEKAAARTGARTGTRKRTESTQVVDGDVRVAAAVGRGNDAGHERVYVQGTQAEIAVLMCFNDDITIGGNFCTPEREETLVALSAQEIAGKVNLSVKEVHSILSLLSHPHNQLLSLCKFADAKVGLSLPGDDHHVHNEKYMLSDNVRSGTFSRPGGSSLETPLVVSLLETQQEWSTAALPTEIHSSHNWRHDLMDACIMRLLKATSRAGSGDCVSFLTSKPTAVPLDILTDSVVKALADRCSVTVNDVTRRAERLAAMGSIEKVFVLSDSLRSVAYSYLSDSSATAVAEAFAATTTVTAATATATTTTTATATAASVSGTVAASPGLVSRGGTVDVDNYSTGAILGDELFDHVRLVLGIDKFTTGTSGISRHTFIDKFIAWISQTNCEIDFSINPLDFLTLLLLEQVRTAAVQLQSLLQQHWEGVKDRMHYCRHELESIRQLRKIDITKVQQLLLGSQPSYSQQLHACLGVSDVLIRHLPEQTVLMIVNSFRNLMGLPELITKTAEEAGASPGRHFGGTREEVRTSLVVGNEEISTDTGSSFIADNDERVEGEKVMTTASGEDRGSKARLSKDHSVTGIPALKACIQDLWTKDIEFSHLLPAGMNALSQAEFAHRLPALTRFSLQSGSISKSPCQSASLHDDANTSVQQDHSEILASAADMLTLFALGEEEQASESSDILAKVPRALRSKLAVTQADASPSTRVLPMFPSLPARIESPFYSRQGLPLTHDGTASIAVHTMSPTASVVSIENEEGQRPIALAAAVSAPESSSPLHAPLAQTLHSEYPDSLPATAATDWSTQPPLAHQEKIETFSANSLRNRLIHSEHPVPAEWKEDGTEVEYGGNRPTERAAVSPNQATHVVDHNTDSKDLESDSTDEFKDFKSPQSFDDTATRTKHFVSGKSNDPSIASKSDTKQGGSNFRVASPVKPTTISLREYFLAAVTEASSRCAFLPSHDGCTVAELLVKLVFKQLDRELKRMFVQDYVSDDDSEDGSVASSQCGDGMDDDGSDYDSSFPPAGERAASLSVDHSAPEQEQHGQPEAFLPCEFCPDVFPANMLEAHQRLCQRMQLEGPVLGVGHTPVQGRIPDNTSATVATVTASVIPGNNIMQRLSTYFHPESAVAQGLRLTPQTGIYTAGVAGAAARTGPARDGSANMISGHVPTQDSFDDVLSPTVSRYPAPMDSAVLQLLKSLLGSAALNCSQLGEMAALLDRERADSDANNSLFMSIDNCDNVAAWESLVKRAALVASQPQPQPHDMSTKSKAKNSSSLSGTSKCVIRSEYSLARDTHSEFADSEFALLLGKVFDRLDLDGDGFITYADFTSKQVSYVDLQAEVDPYLLYGLREQSLLGDNTIDKSKIDLVNLTCASRIDPAADEACGNDLPSAPALVKTDSLWTSVSTERALPPPPINRSLRGLEEAERELDSLVQQTKDVIDDSEDTALALLIHYGWDIKRLVEVFLENPRPVRLAVGLGPRHRPHLLRFDLFGSASTDDVATAGGGSSTTVACSICMDIVGAEKAFALTCRHWFCSDCWEGYLDSQVSARSVPIRCPQSKCELVVPAKAPAIFCSPATGAQAKGNIVRAYVEARLRLRPVVTYCKNPRGCSGVIVLADDSSAHDAMCSLCGCSFCASCDFPPHAPASCDLVSKWDQRGGFIETGRNEDVEVRKLKHMTTKPCPKCGVRIEKNLGCPHMSCICKHQFCWDCGGDYHTSDRCIKPKATASMGSILHFEEIDKQCATHFLARQIALKSASSVQEELERHCHLDLPLAARRRLQVRRDGYQAIAEAQSALAHATIVMFTHKSKKFEFLCMELKSAALGMQQRVDRLWGQAEQASLVQARISICCLHKRTRDFLAVAQTEIGMSDSAQLATLASPRTGGLDGGMNGASVGGGARVTSQGSPTRSNTPRRRGASSPSVSGGGSSSTPRRHQRSPWSGASTPRVVHQRSLNVGFGGDEGDERVRGFGRAFGVGYLITLNWNTNTVSRSKKWVSNDAFS